MKKSFQNIDILIGENFSANTVLNALIESHLETIGIIFPTTNSVTLSFNLEKKITHLIFIDGTWKKTKKIFFLSKNLHRLVTYSLQPSFPSQYKIRSSQLKNSLSTLEAAILSLKIVEEKLDTKSLENSFLKMIEFQIDKMGEEIFNKNYTKKYEQEE